MNDPIKIELVDISAEVFGKYQYCTMAHDGMWYADSDFTYGAGVGKPEAGALPAPRQDTPELTAKARAMHDAAATKLVKAALSDGSAPPSTDPVGELGMYFGLMFVAFLVLCAALVRNM